MATITTEMKTELISAMRAVIAKMRPIVEACDQNCAACPIQQLYDTYFNLHVTSLEEGSAVACELFYDPEDEW